MGAIIKGAETGRKWDGNGTCPPRPHLLLIHHHRLNLPEGREVLRQFLGRRPAGEAADEEAPLLLGAPLGPEAPPAAVLFAAEVILQTGPCTAERQRQRTELRYAPPAPPRV